ncbi:uncharacterized protein LOC118741861 [Rhagoletis pomonella]|uniref:uncharacterized protein LOC118741861 n=1 Tax=Rhagoletis pomonella TaxID=28610 RepID=UPI0017813F97|nr:uncharacterized protein LOC118741861 [Rhagoletis pomonella]
MSVNWFVRCSDEIIEFNANFDEALMGAQPNSSLTILKGELVELWEKTKKAYEKCLQSLKEDADIEGVRSKYATTFRDYLSCSSRIDENMEKFNPNKEDVSRTIAQAAGFSDSLHLPPCDTNIFDGDYASWPSFRDLFTAIYINNSRLSGVQKLYHLLQKTSGEAREIVSNSQLTNQGFETAWSNLKATYENKRVLVNSQLKKLFSLPVIRTESASALKDLQRSINACLSALEIYNIDVTNWDPVLIFLCSNRLPETTLSMWENTLLDKSALPEWKQMNAFLIQRFRTLESIVDVKYSTSLTSTHQQQRSFTHPHNPLGQKKLSLATNVISSYCVMCPKQQHVLRLCKKFLSLSVSDRFALIKKHNCCLNCLSKGHSVKECKSKFSCTTCKSRHHSLLHRVAPNTQHKDASNHGTASQAFHVNIQSTSRGRSSSPNPENSASSSLSSALLGTAMVHICHLGSTYFARALIDSASEASFISERLRKLLKLPCSKANAVISGLNQTVCNSSLKICSFILGSPRDPNLFIEANAFVLPHITGNLPSTSIDSSILDELPKVPFADSKFLQSGPIDVLIGGDLYPKVMLEGVKRSVCNNFLSQETVFGWIVTGASSTAHVSCFATKISLGEDNPLDCQLRKFWELEEIPKRNIPSAEDSFCEELFLKTTTRNSEGRPIALRQYLRNEARLMKTLSLKGEYDKVVREYLDLGHMEEVKPPLYDHSPNHFYLPHHAVLKPESTSTKLRVVFNASSNSSNGNSTSTSSRLAGVISIGGSNFKSAMYVDDVLAGFHQISTALQARNELIQVLYSAGFSLRKWSSNTKELIADLPDDHLLGKEFLDLDETSTTKALGIRWNAKLDHFFFNVQDIVLKSSYNKREVLSIIAKLFDPAGWLAPIVVIAKILMQQIWLDGTTWDQPISSQTLSKWKFFVENYGYIQNIKVPRWMNCSNETPIQIHAFCDASEKAYAGVIYLRVENNKLVTSQLLLAKTKVAPIKKISIPRLELCGAVLLVDMLNCLRNELPFKVENTFCWTDSTIVLSWLKKQPGSWTTFVANRVAKVQEAVDFRYWNHVESKDNPADLGSRGVYPQDLTSNELWWYGPSWLTKEEANWPSLDQEIEDTTVEAKRINAHNCAALTPGHFLIGAPLLSPIEPSIETNPISLINRWQRLKALSQQLSIRWKEEYLKELHKRYKWKYPQTDISVDDLVVVRHEHLPPNEWRLGRVTKVYQGNDRRARVADIRTQKGMITRPIVKLVVLPQ